MVGSYQQLHVSAIMLQQHTGYLQWTVRKNHSIFRTSWATGHQPRRQLQILPPTRKYLATIHPVKFLITTHIHLTTLYVSMLHRMDMILHASEHTSTCN